ncbi:MAG: tyrosine-type recombinase/integrase [Dysosmobacter sp.]
MDRCGLPSINYHALRHTLATRCIELGVDVKTLSEILGHANVFYHAEHLRPLLHGAEAGTAGKAFCRIIPTA